LIVTGVPLGAVEIERDLTIGGAVVVEIIPFPDKLTTLGTAEALLEILTDAVRVPS
jgi:hypothetical protein